MIKIVFMGTPDFAVPSLEALIPTGNVVGVVTQPDRPAGRGNKLRQPPVKVAALNADLPVYQPESLRSRDAAAPIAAWQPDLIVVAAFGQILRRHLLELPRLGCVNVHASLLPRWRGASPIQHAILAGDAETGVTLMQMDRGLDTGDMLVKESLMIATDETAATLHDRLAALGGEMMTRYLPDLLNGRLSPTPQSDDEANYAPLISKTDGRLDWSEAAVALDRRLRAMSPWPGATTTWQGKPVKILSAVPLADVPPQGKIGEVVNWQGNTAVQTGQGVFQLDHVQLAGKKATQIADFVRGRPQFIGAILE